MEAALNGPYDVCVDSKDNLYIADLGNHLIRKVDRQGIITTVAGTEVAGYSGDGGPAMAAQLHGPYDVFIDQKDNLLIADSLNHVIRKIWPDGKITTVAGTGQEGYSGDGGPALAAVFNTPSPYLLMRKIDPTSTTSTINVSASSGRMASSPL